MIHTFGILRKNASKGMRQLIQAPEIDQSTGSTRNLEIIRGVEIICV